MHGAWASMKRTSGCPQLNQHYSSGQFGRISAAGEVVSARRMSLRSATKPIMAALSVQRPRSANRSSRPWREQAARQPLAQSAVAGNPARRGDTANAEPARSAQGLGHQHLHDGRLDAGRQVAQSLRVAAEPGLIAQKISHRGLQSAEAEVIIGLVEHGTGKTEAAGSPLRPSDRFPAQPGYGKPRSLPTLSKHSPAASSSVEPSTRCLDSPSTCTSSVWPPLAMSDTFGSNSEKTARADGLESRAKRGGLRGGACRRTDDAGRTPWLGPP